MLELVVGRWQEAALKIRELAEVVEEEKRRQHRRAQELAEQAAKLLQELEDSFGHLEAQLRELERRWQELQQGFLEAQPPRGLWEEIADLGRVWEIWPWKLW